MLEAINIKGLFGLYDYDILLKNDRSEKIHFITAPNGFGKTTILDMVYHIVKGDFRQLLTVPFKKCSLLFENEQSLSLERSETFPELNEDSDEFQKPVVTLSVVLSRNNEQVEFFDVDENTGDFDSSFSSDFRIDNRGANTDMFLRSMICDYITDARILETKTDDGIRHASFSLIDLRSYTDKVKAILNDPVKSKGYSDRLMFFKKTVDALAFANKTMELHQDFGFRFVSKDANKTIVPIQVLSSGEKHMLIQLCELLFMAKEGALVLIDEPELSLHMAWQYQYLKIINSIATLCGFQFVIATHSPQVFNAEWSRTSDLYSLFKGLM